MPNVILRAEDGTTFSVPKEIHLKASQGDEEAQSYVEQAHHLTKGDFEPPIPNVKPPTELQTDEQQREGLQNIGPALMDFITSPKGMIRSGISKIMEGPPALASGDIKRGAHDIYSGAMEALTPAAIPTAIANPIPAISGLATGYLGQEAARKSAEYLGANPDTVDIAGDIGSLLGAAPAISPKVRSMGPGFVEGVKSVPPEPMRGHGITGLATSAIQHPVRGMLGLGGALLAKTFAPETGYVGELGGGLAGYELPRMGKAALAGGKSAIQAFQNEPRAFNWTDNSITPEVLDPGPHPFAYSGNPASRRLSPASQFQMPPVTESYSGPPMYNTMADLPPKALPPASTNPYEMPPAGSHAFTLDPSQLKGLPYPGEEPIRTRSAVPMEGNEIQDLKDRLRLGVKEPKRSAIKVSRPNTKIAEEKPNEPSKTTESKESKKREPETKIAESKKPEEKNTITSPETSREWWEDRESLTMKEVNQLAEQNHTSYQAMSKALKAHGKKIVSDVSSFEESAKKYGLNTKGKKVK